MSSILDALRKSHPRKPRREPAAGAPSDPASGDPAPSGDAAASPLEKKQPVPAASAPRPAPAAPTPPKPARSSPPAAGSSPSTGDRPPSSEPAMPAPGRGVADAPAESRPTKPMPPPSTPVPEPPAEVARVATDEAPGGCAPAAPPAVTPGAGATTSSPKPRSEPLAVTPSVPLPPPLGEFPLDEDHQLLASAADADARRKRFFRAGVVVGIGVVLGLTLGDRFLSGTAPESEDLLTDAALQAKATAVPPAATPTPAAPVEASPAEDAGNARAAARADKKAGRASKAPHTTPPPAVAAPGAPPAATVASPPAPAAAPPTPAPVAVPPSPVPPGPMASAAPTAATRSEPAAATPPSPAPPQPAVAATPPAAAPQPPAPPAVLPPLPDDAPQVALLFIQWSPQPERRVASLRQSGGTISIVHEGDVIQGLKIGQIRPSALEMQWRGMSYSLPASRH